MSNDPHTINHGRLLELLRGLGIEQEPGAEFKSIHIEGGRAEVVRYRLDEHGRRYVVGPNELATVTTTIRVEPSK